MGLQEDMAGASKRDLECFMILLPGMYAEKLNLPIAMAQAVVDRRELELCLDDEQGVARRRVGVLADGGHLYLGRGWTHFARALDLHDRYCLVLWYDGRSQINVKVFDLTTCRKQYPNNSKAGGRSLYLALPILEPRSFAEILKKYNLTAKYLNVPVDFEQAHGYGDRNMVELKLAGKSGFMGLERSITKNACCTLLKYGWAEFCSENDLNVGDTCFFSVICMATCRIDDNKWEEKEEEVDPEMKVEVHTMNGG